MPHTLERLKEALADRYRVARELGRGGMGTVYLARDIRHDRDVAIKVFRREFSAALGAERFLSEIRAMAGIQHPNILPLHDSGSADDLLYFVMPFIEGESLKDRLVRERQLPTQEAVRIATEVANGLGAAHESGIVHRDIKPGNILLGEAGALIADFGIALSRGGEEEQRLTETGLSLGTPQYMAPEQATGDQPTDARSDIYALGGVLYEMLVGEPPHTGTSMQAILAHVVTSNPEGPRLKRQQVPAHVDAVVRCALERVPADRFQTCRELADALADEAFRHGLDPSAGARRLRMWRTSTAVLSAVTLGFAGLFMAGSFRSDVVEPGPPTRFAIPYGEGEGYARSRVGVAISPSASHVAYAGGTQTRPTLRLRARDQLDSWVVPGSGSAFHPFFSPDGEWLGYTTVNGLFKVPLIGGAPERIVGFAEPRGPEWGAEGVVLFGSYGGLWSVGEDGSNLTQLTSVDVAQSEAIHSRPRRIPGSDDVLFTIGTTAGEFRIAVYHASNGSITDLGQGLSPVFYDGRLLFGQPDGTVLASAYDPRSGTLTGTPVEVLADVRSVPGALEFDISDDGSIVYVTGRGARSRLMSVDRSGNATPLTDEADTYNAPRFSPGGDRLLFGVGSPPTRQVWTMDLEQRLLSPLTFEGHNYYGTWSHDGSRVAFARESGTTIDIFVRAADGSGEAEEVFSDGGVNYPEAWSPDGERILFRTQSGEGQEHDIWSLDLTRGGEPVPLLNQPAQEEAPKISPDGAWLAYTTDISGRQEVYVTTFPRVGARHQVSISGGTEPVWSPGSDELFYWRADTLVAATVHTEGGFVVQSRVDLFAGAYMRWPFHANYDIHPDGDRFVIVERRGDSGTRVVVALDWAVGLPPLAGGGD